MAEQGANPLLAGLVGAGVGAGVGVAAEQVEVGPGRAVQLFGASAAATVAGLDEVDIITLPADGDVFLVTAALGVVGVTAASVIVGDIVAAG